MGDEDNRSRAVIDAALGGVSGLDLTQNVDR